MVTGNFKIMNLTSYLDENIKNGDYCTKPPNLENIVWVFHSDKLVSNKRTSDSAMENVIEN